MKKILVLFTLMLTSCSFNIEHLVETQEVTRIVIITGTPLPIDTLQPTHTAYPIPTMYPWPDACDQNAIELPCIWTADESIGESWESIAMEVYGDPAMAITILNWNRDENGFRPVTMGELYIPHLDELHCYHPTGYELWSPCFPRQWNYTFTGYDICGKDTTPRPCLAMSGNTWEWFSELYNVPIWALEKANLDHDGMKFITLPDPYGHMIMIPRVGE